MKITIKTTQLLCLLFMFTITGCSMLPSNKETKPEPPPQQDTSVTNPKETFSTDKTGEIHATVSAFPEYSDAYQAFFVAEQLIEQHGSITLQQLTDMGFGQDKSPIIMHNHHWVIRKFQDNPEMNYTAPESIKSCIKKRKKCKALVIKLESSHTVKDNDGSMLGIARHYANWGHLKRTQYWALKTTFVVNDNKVIYAIADEISPPQYTVQNKTISIKEKISGGLLKAVLPF